MVSCIICRRTFSKYGFPPHFWRAHTSEGQQQKAFAGKIPWNKGLTNETDVRVALISAKASKALKGKAQNISPESEKIRRAKISNRMKIVGGGYRQGSGRGKSGWYKGYWCDSSYELAWVIYGLDHHLSFKRNTEKFPYVWEERIRYWIPDFILCDNIYVEIKGFLTEQNKAKHSQFQPLLVVFQRNDLNRIFDYVYKVYGKDFINLYD